MKAFLSIGACLLAVVFAIPAMACETEKKEIRNDRVSVSKNIQQFDINPFSDSKSIARNDHIRYSHPKIQADHFKDLTDTQKRRYIRNDHVIITK